MLNKLRLDQTKIYEKSVATFEISQMLVAFVQGRAHSLSIGSEQGGINNWDDFIILEADETLKHIQVKRQQTDFSNHKCIRGHNREGNPIPLSTLDRTMESLADWTNQNDPNTVIPRRRFVIELPDNTTYIKEEIQVRDFYELCHSHIRPVTTAKGLEHLVECVTSARNCYNWLKTWCSFNDCDHILKALRILEIKLIGNENDINSYTENTLAPVFNNTSEVRRRIISYIDDNSTFTGAITPRPLLNLLKNYLLPEISTWTQYQKTGSKWRISGTHDLEFNEVERALQVVPLLWSNNRARHLKLDLPTNDSTILSKNIVQLALHLQGQVNAHFIDLNGWRQIIISLIGGTLGISCTDCETLSIAQNSCPFLASDCRVLNDRNEIDGEADNIKREMIKVTFKMVIKQLEGKLDEMQPSDLRDAVEKRWEIWRSEFEKNPSDLISLFSSMLYPNAEGDGISSELRVGPKTASLIAEGIYLLLIVSVALSDTNENWITVGENLSINTIALSYWSDPSMSPRKVRKLCDEGIETLIGKEPFDVLLLPQSEISPVEIFKESLASNYYDDLTLASAHRPKLLITNNIKLKKIISRGNIEELRSYLISEIDNRTTSLRESIQEAI